MGDWKNEICPKDGCGTPLLSTSLIELDTKPIKRIMPDNIKKDFKKMEAERRGNKADKKQQKKKNQEKQTTQRIEERRDETEMKYAVYSAAPPIKTRNILKLNVYRRIEDEEAVPKQIVRSESFGLPFSIHPESSGST